MGHSADDLNRIWYDTVRHRTYDYSPRFTEAGLCCGAGTVLVKAAGGTVHLAGAEARVLALLEAAYGETVPRDVLPHFDRAVRAWNAGDETRALIHIAFARLPPLPDRAAVHRLFLAGGLLDAGVKPEALGLDVAITGTGDILWKRGYDPGQPRRPSGPGGGQWVRDGSAGEASADGRGDGSVRTPEAARLAAEGTPPTPVLLAQALPQPADPPPGRPNEPVRPRPPLRLVPPPEPIPEPSTHPVKSLPLNDLGAAGVGMGVLGIGVLASMDALEQQQIAPVLDKFGFDADERGIAAARAYRFGPLRLNGVFTTLYGQPLLTGQPMQDEAIAAALMLAEFTQPGLIDRFSETRSRRIGAILKDAVDEALGDPAAMIERAHTVRVIEVTTPFLRAINRQAEINTGRACAVDPFDLVDLDPDDITRRTGEKGGEPTGEPERKPKASRETQEALKAEIEAGDILAKEGYPTEYQPKLLERDLAEGLDKEKNPDLRVDGKIYDAYAPFTDNIDKIRNKISEKIKECQTRRVVVTLKLTDDSVTVERLIRRLETKPIKNLKELFVIDKQKFVRHFVFLTRGVK